jgi:hypothetical protein
MAAPIEFHQLQHLRLHVALRRGHYQRDIHIANILRRIVRRRRVWTGCRSRDQLEAGSDLFRLRFFIWHSFYVQKMFADSRLDSVVPVQVSAAEMKLRADGGVSAESLGAQAEFQDEKVTGSGEDYTYSVRARKTGGDGGLVIRFAIQDGGGSYLAWFLGVRHRASTLLVWGGGDNQDVPAHQLESSFLAAISPAVAGMIDADRWYDVKIRVDGRRIQCYLNGKEIHNVEVPESLGPSVHGAAGRTVEGEIVVRLVNASPVRQDVNIDLAGSSASKYSAVATQLSSKNLDEENSLAEPTRIAPIERQLSSVGSKFQYELEGSSFTVLKLTPARK